MFSYVWFEQPKMAKKEPSIIQWLSNKHNSFIDLICFRGIFATIFHEVFISPSSYLISGSAIYVPDSSRSLLIRRIWKRACTRLCFACRSHISFSINLFWLIFARFNLHWALSNRLSYREEIGKMTFAEFFTTPLRAQPDWVRAVLLSPFMCGRKTQQWHTH